jgi:hypothetical protein
MAFALVRPLSTGSNFGEGACTGSATKLHNLEINRDSKNKLLGFFFNLRCNLTTNGR